MMREPVLDLGWNVRPLHQKSQPLNSRLFVQLFSELGRHGRIILERLGSYPDCWLAGQPGRTPSLLCRLDEHAGNLSNAGWCCSVFYNYFMESVLNVNTVLSAFTPASGECDGSLISGTGKVVASGVQVC